MILGEDIEWLTDFTEKEYGGAFKVTKDLSVLYQGRVRNTPISEAAISGIGIGYAFCGDIAIIEIMFGDFLTLSFDQLLQHASKFCTMYGKKIELPL